MKNPGTPYRLEMRADSLSLNEKVSHLSTRTSRGVFPYHEGSSLKPEDVREFCRGRIAWHKIPRYVAVVDDFPRTGNGKVQKFRLREMAKEIFPNVK